ncbi:MAG: M48 family metallopeptidase [Pseudomonadales bacterium]
MNFFEQQERARSRTGLLVLLFALAVCCLVAATCLLVALFGGVLQIPAPGEAPGYATMPGLLEQVRALPRETVAGISVLVFAVVGLAALFKLAQLSGGGSRVAEALGGRLLNVNTRDASEKRLLNVVEEMAIAAGVPVPPVYLLEERGINAFAAGTTPQNAAIGITRGAIEQLDRDELQGVIAHEFSHIFNGDMRLNLRLIGVLYGILVLGTVGYHIMRAASRGARRSRDNGAMPLLVLGGGLMLIGYAGTFFGNLIKAAVSRQREFLADASAVQFTRNPGGIGGALKKIGGFDGANAAGSKLAHPGAAEVSHLFFAQGVSFLFNALFATHPPLEERIRRIDPRWHADSGAALQVSPEKHGSSLESSITSSAATAAFSDAAAIVDRAGMITPELTAHAAALYAGLPAPVSAAIHEPYAARALVFCLLLDRAATIRESQLALLQAHLDAPTYAAVRELQSVVQGRDADYLEMLDLAIPALKQLSAAQAERFDYLLDALIRIDNKIELLEWSLYNIVRINLQRNDARGYPLQRARDVRLLARPLAVVLSVVAYAGVYESLYEALAPGSESGEVAVAESFRAAANALGLGGMPQLPRHQVTVDRFVQALALVERVRPLQKPLVLKALVAAAMHDRELRPLELQLLRAIALSLNCPLPPVESSYT